MKTIFTLFFFSLVCFAFAQNTFKTHVFSDGQSYLQRSAQLADGSFVSCGYIDDADGDMWLIKTNAAGTVIAKKNISTAGYDEGYSIIKTTDGGFAVAGLLSDQMGLIKCNADLTIQWQRYYGVSNGLSGALKVIQTSDGGYLLAGSVSDANEDFAGSVVKTNSQGVVQFQKRYFGFSNSYINNISPMKDGNFAFIAIAYGPNDNTVDTSYVGKMAPDGSILWVKQFYDNSYATQEFSGVIGASDGSIVASGYAEDQDGDVHMTLVKFSSTGTLTWSKVLSDPNGGSEAYNVLEDKDGGYLFGGYSYDVSSENGFVVKTTPAGLLQYTKTFEYGADGYLGFTDLIATSDGGYATSGYGYFLAEDNDLDDGGFIYKFNSSFETCNETSGSVSETLLNFGVATTLQLPVANTGLITVTSAAAITDDADFTVVYPCSVLPVAFTSFAATLQGRNVAVKWTTANEVNTDHFIVERSADRTSFDALQRVAAKGNSSVQQSYIATDLQPLPGTSYYRLKEVDKDGKVTYTSIVPVTVMSNGTIVISPNPVQSVMHVIVQSIGSNNLMLQVVDMKGNVLAMQNQAVGAGRNEIDIAASSLAKGVYILKVTDSRTTQAIRFVKE